MPITYQWADAEHTSIRASDGRFIPPDPRNDDFAAIDPDEILPFQPEPSVNP